MKSFSDVLRRVNIEDYYGSVSTIYPDAKPEEINLVASILDKIFVPMEERVDFEYIAKEFN